MIDRQDGNCLFKLWGWLLVWSQKKSPNQHPSFSCMSVCKCRGNKKALYNINIAWHRQKTEDEFLQLVGGRGHIPRKKTVFLGPLVACITALAGRNQVGWVPSTSLVSLHPSFWEVPALLPCPSVPPGIGVGGQCWYRCFFISNCQLESECVWWEAFFLVNTHMK